MKKNTFSIAVAIIAFAFIFIACGGEDCTGEDCNEPTDETSVTDEEIDENQISDSDILIEDMEKNDEDSATVPCDQDPTCQEVCKNFLDKSGHWNRKESDLDPGSIDVTLFVCEDECCFDTTGSKQWSFKSTNRDYPAEFPSPIYFFSLRKTDSETFVVEKKQEKEGETEEVITFIR